MPYILHDLTQCVALGLDLYYTDTAQNLITAGYDVHDLDRDPSDV